MMYKNKNLILLIFFIIITCLSYLSYNLLKPSLLSKIKKSKELNIVFLNAQSTYYIGVNGEEGFEYHLLKSYAEYLGVELKITTVNTVEEAIGYRNNPSIHIISASFTKTPSRKHKFNFGPSYFEVQQQVVCNRSMIGKRNFPRNIDGLSNLNLRVGEGTSYSETIRSLVKDGFDLNATFSSEYSTEELLKQVSSHEIDCTIADSNIYALNLRYYPEMDMAFTISGREQLAWVLAENSDELAKDMYVWLNDFTQRGKMAQLKDHYYSNVHFFDYYDTKIFYKRIRTRLVKYKKFFLKAAKKYNIPWKLLAAMSYQESHWNPSAKSFTGVRGMMMLTRTTAKTLGVENRLDPEQSILGGAKYIKKMIKLVPQDVKDENRLKFALAAYNVGRGHIQDARKLAKRLGYNQSIWSDLKKVLPLLEKKIYYARLKYGYARGEEAVKYVEAIYDYRDILEKISRKDIK